MSRRRASEYTPVPDAPVPDDYGIYILFDTKVHRPARQDVRWEVDDPVSYSRKKLDLMGQRFGKLTVLAPAENIGSRTAWLCRCDCGRETVVKTQHLRSGHTVSCGCMPSLTYVDGTCVEMLRSKTVRRNNTSGVPGVDWRPKRGLWRASICFQGKRLYLGSYHKFEDAVKARRQAEEALHDRFLEEFDAADQKAAGN